MRLAYITETWPPDLAGAASYAERSVRYLHERGHRLDLIRPRRRGQPLGIDLRPGAGVAALRQRFREQQQQLVHVATLGRLGRAAVLAANSLGLPVSTDFCPTFHAHGSRYRLGWLEPALHRYLRSFHNRASRTFVPTPALREQLAQQGFERLEVLGRGVDPLLFWPGRRSRALRAAWGADDERQLVMLYVGRLEHGSNVALALRAFEAIRYLRPGTRMVVVGDGALRGRLQAQFPNACFAGVQRGEALAQHYASADLFVLPSHNESFGNATLEALASGLALVAFDAAAAAVHVRSDSNGLLVEPGDEAGFIGAAARAAVLAAPGSPLRLRARESALGASWDAVLRRLDSRLCRLAEDDAPQRRPHVAIA